MVRQLLLYELCNIISLIVRSWNGDKLCALNRPVYVSKVRQEGPGMTQLNLES